ncbi:MAG: penicillin acylase family protein [Enterobacterales bacterium]|nr:penicillin acylase family protein [Enterobacterales bacterium]
MLKLKSLPLAIVGLFLFAWIISYLYLYLGLPNLSGEYQLKGIHGKITVIRDQHSVPHIFAKDQDDLAFALGFVMAQDRLWQMDLFKRVATGRLSEVFGKRSIKADRFAKIIGFNTKARLFEKRLKLSEKNYLQAFVRGINYYIKSHPDKQPIEFLALEYQPEIFTVNDILALTYYKSFVASRNWTLEVLRSLAIEELGETKGRQLVAATSFNGPYMAEPEIELNSEGQAHFVSTSGDKQPPPSSNATETKVLQQKTNEISNLYLAMLNIDTQVKALSGLESNQAHSNYWAIAASRSQSGKAIFANDYHMPFLLPSLWYEVHLVADGINAMGITMPGSPIILAGHNQHIAWGATTTGADTQDLFQEKLNPNNNDEYLYQGKYYPFKIRKEKIHFLQDGVMKTETIRVKESRHGPIINDIIKQQNDANNVMLKSPIALKSIDEAIEGQILFAMDIYRATNWVEFKAAIAQVNMPVWNWGYADNQGNIGYKMNGKIPIRVSGQGLEPQDGWSGDYDWKGYVAFDDLPELYNPKQGFIVSANNEITLGNRIQTKGGSYPISTSTFQLPYRAIRIEQLIKAKSKLTQQDIRDIQQDTKSLFALALKKEIFLAIKNQNELPKEIIPLLDIIRDYDGQTDINSIANSIIQEFFIHLLKNTYANKISEKLFEHYIKAGKLNYVAGILLANLNSTERQYWFDDPNTAIVETKQQIIVTSLVDTLSSLSHFWGDDVTQWRWGDLHQTLFQHQLGRVAPLGLLLNIGPDEFPGDIATVNPGVFHKIDTKPYRVEHGASMRHIIDFGHTEQSDIIITTGQSGRWFSPFYKDQTDLWRQGMYLSLNLDKKTLEANSRSVTHFLPIN